MPGSPRLKEKYTLAGCCHPRPDAPITGYFSHNDQIRVHRSDCPRLSAAPPDRLITLLWDDVIATEAAPVPVLDEALAPLDFAILRHHRDLGIDYSLKVARALNTDRQAVFECHRRLREAGLLERVEPTMVQYRKGIVERKWIKHRNHTYYRITERGAAALQAPGSAGRDDESSSSSP